MQESRKRGSWTATQVRALVATGLASAHLQPFVRLLYNDPKTRVCNDTSSRTILVESRDADDNVMCRRQRERNGKYTASWSTGNGSGEVFTVHPVVDWVELQLWNHFDNGFDVFLGKASVSLHQLHQQCSRENKERDSLRTDALWFPLQSSETNGVASRTCLEIECVFTSDPKVLRIQNAMQQRQCVADVKEDNATSFVDPTFAFTQPLHPVEWSLIASTSVRHLFFHSDVERLANFRELVLYGDIEKELDDDDELQIDKNHLTAFRVCQFSAQYLDHCVDTLSQRLDEYSDDYRALTETKVQLARKNKVLIAQQRRLQKEHDDLDLLITTYQRVLNKNGDELNIHVKKIEQLKQLSSPNQNGIISEALSPPTSPTGSSSSKKPMFLKTCKRERQMENDLSKAQRLEVEKQRINQRVLERQQRDDYDTLWSIATEKRKYHAAKKIQAFFHNIRVTHRIQRDAAEYRAATHVQAAWKRYIHVKKYPRRLETRKQEVELLLMAQSEQEKRQWMAKMQKSKASPRTKPSSDSTNDENVVVETWSTSISPSKQVVDALVTTWRKLHRVFVLAHKTKGIDYNTLFDQIDLRKDEVIDRAELRLGARSFGVRLDRKITRALITLLRTKCGLTSKPLLVTFEQFLKGFELIPQIAKPLSSIPPQAESEFFKDDKENIMSASADGSPVRDSLDTQGKKMNDEEKLYMAVRSFRAAINESATSFLISEGKSSTNYKVYRDALAHIFSQFDTDRNGYLDVNELITCMAPLNLRLTNDQSSLLRELFVNSHESDKVCVTEFISFVLNYSSSSGDDGLGHLGHRIRKAIFKHVRKAQAQINDFENAVRFVFRAAYKHPDQQSCSVQDFMRALNRMHLDVTPVQIARLVIKLDRDGNCFISFDELLVWLRLHSKNIFGNGSQETSIQAPALQLANVEAVLLRIILEKLAFAHAPPISPKRKETSFTALFHHIDRDSRGEINQEGLLKFLNTQDLLSLVGEDNLKQLCGLSSLPHDPTAVVAQKIINLIDLNANGFATLKEWVTFCQHDARCDSDDPEAVEAMRKILRGSVGNDIDQLLIWFNELPGTIQAAIGRQGGPAQKQIRVANLKVELRVKLGGAQSVSLQAIDRIVNSLDKDRSGWITTSELCAWAFPSRDLEELLRLIIDCWQKEHQKLSNDELASSLYTCFDLDNNGSLAVRELRQGFETYGLTLSVYEARVLLIAFDRDGDGCWNKAELEAFVSNLFPLQSFVSDPSINPVQHTKDKAEHSTENVTLDDEDESSSESAYSADLSFISGSSRSLSLPVFSKEGEDGAYLGDYSEDFVEDCLTKDSFLQTQTSNSFVAPCGDCPLKPAIKSTD